MNKKVKLLKTVTLWGNDVNPGEVIEVNDVSADALVNEGAAEHVEAEEGSQDPAGDGENNNEGGQQDPAAEAAAIEMQKAALDAQYKKDDLAEAAKAVGVEFHYDAKKADIIEAVIAAGKASVLMK